MYGYHFFLEDYFYALVERQRDYAEIVESLSPYDDVIRGKGVDNLELIHGSDVI